MASPSMLAAFKEKKPSKFADEGPPVDDPKEAAFGAETADEEGGEAEEMGGGGDMRPSDDAPAAPYDAEAKAVDDMADILGVGPEDREDFGMALKTYVSECFAKMMGPEEAAEGEMGPGMPPMSEPGGEPEEA